jgi:hypothetical protein
MRENLEVTLFKILVLGGTMYVATTPSHSLIIRPPNDGRMEKNHCCNNIGETRELVV